MIKDHKRTVKEILGRNSVHPFPARMAAGIALNILSDAKKQLRVLDPMSGSGTVLAVARANGHKAYGVDIDPLAVLIAKVWTTKVEVSQAKALAIRCLKNAERQTKLMYSKDAFPKGADDETRAFISFWFDTQGRKKLTALSNSIRKVKKKKYRDVLWCAFSRLIISKSNGASLAMDLSHSRPHKVYDTAPLDPFSKFLQAVDTVLENCVSGPSAISGPASKVVLGDARNLPFSEGNFDFILTSPPYLNAIDYLRCSKFSLVWMGHSIASLRKIRSASIGSESVRKNSLSHTDVDSAVASLKIKGKLSDRQFKMFLQYANDMNASIYEVSRVLRPGGKVIYIIGENTLKGVYIPTAKLLSLLAKKMDLNLVEKRTRMLPSGRRYLPPPKNGKKDLNLRMRKEIVLAFEKSA